MDAGQPWGSEAEGAPGTGGQGSRGGKSGLGGGRGGAQEGLFVVEINNMVFFGKG